MKKIIICFGLVLTLILSACSSSKLELPDTELAKHLPELNFTKGEVSDYDDTIFIDGNSSEKETKEYIEKCKEEGFTIEAEKDGFYDIYYAAYDSDGYFIKISYDKDDKEINIEFNAPKLSKDDTLVWPTKGPATLLPKPTSSNGSISIDNSDRFFCYVGGVSLNELQSYADECSKAGFNKDYKSTDQHYEANNGDYKIFIKYEGFNIISIDIYEKDYYSNLNESSENSTDDISDTDSSNDTTDSDTSSEVDPDFKKSMDKYEDFFDEYVEFMNKYNNSDNVSSEMLSDYSDYMDKYSDTMDSLNKIDTSKLSTADYNYYIEVNSRIMDKLSKIS